jgi:hypothetical protein
VSGARAARPGYEFQTAAESVGRDHPQRRIIGTRHREEGDPE